MEYLNLAREPKLTILGGKLFQLWDLADVNESSVCKSCRQALRRVWKVPFNCHTAIIGALSISISIFDILCKRTLKFIRSSLASGNDIVNFVARNGICIVAECPPVSAAMFGLT